MNNQQFCIRWNSHLGSLGAAFPQMLAGQRFVDVTLACEGHQVHCHRLVLAACSTYFEALLGENPCKHPIIILPRDIKLWEIQALVDFMYKGEVNVSSAGLPDLIKCAEMLQIRGLCGADAALYLNTVTDAKETQEETPKTDEQYLKSSPDVSPVVDTSEITRLLDTSMDTDGASKSKTDNSQPPSEAPPSCGTIRVISNENLFENYNQLSMGRNDGDIPTIEVEDESEDIMRHLLPPSLKYNSKSMSISVRSGRASSVESCENIICSPNLEDPLRQDDEAINGEDDASSDAEESEDMDLPPLIPFSKGQQTIKQEPPCSPPKAFVLRNPRGNQPRSYNIDALWAALMNVKAGESIYRASQIHKVPRKTLRNWMKRWDIKSSFPMPRQLRQAAEKKRLSRIRSDR
ncbi:protein jim lovell-like [Lutzomyia longipalpis]|uniref:protein jim lovell-like n=1 Tax=Lutzomyia longipalpis TaxID=7200 RepID=UPI002483BAD7|nr:protein jim lovell-like [Lutzomyia longipalpis]